MIKQGDRRWSVRTQAEQREMLKAELEMLSPEQRKLVKALMKDMSEGETSLYDTMTEYRWRWKPVHMDQFLEDPYYLGESCQTLYPQIREDLTALMHGHGYREAILTGSIGYGKTTFASIAMCRMLYEISCLRAPQLAYGLSPGSEIVVACMSKSLHLARTVLKSAIDDKLKLSPYFSEKFDPQFSRDYTRFQNNIMLSIGSCNSERVLGMNVIGGVMDEANFMTAKGQVMQQGYGKKKTVANFDLAEKVYAGLVRRVKSRFLKASADLPGLMCLVSSAGTIGSFIDRRLEESKDDPEIFARDYATWDVKPASHFCGETFRVLIGNSSLRSRVLEPTEAVPQRDIDEGCKLIDVPTEYLEDFSRDLENAIRDIAGISTHAISPFLHRHDKIYERINKAPHPFTDEEYTYGTEAGFMWDRICVPKKVKLKGGFEEETWIPRVNPAKPRHVHIDPSLSGDSTGLAMGHISHWVEVVRRAPDGKEYNDLAPYIIIDFMLRINPPFGEQIFLPDVRRLVYELHQHGFQIGGFTCDSYQSAETIQQMSRRGVKSEVLSVDRTTDPYDSLKASIYEDRIEYYDYAPFLEEVKALEYDRIRGKVDHPQAGTKDVADAVTGVVFGLGKSAARLPLAPVVSRAETDQEDMGWITEGKIPWDKDKELPEKINPYKDGPLGLIIG